MILRGPLQLWMFHDSVILVGAFQLWIFHDSERQGMFGQIGHQDFGISGIFLGCPVQDSRILVGPFQSGHSTFPWQIPCYSREYSLYTWKAHVGTWIPGALPQTSDPTKLVKTVSKNQS